MGDGEDPKEPDEVGRLLRVWIRPYAISIIILGAGLGGFAAFQAVKSGIHVYERYPAEGPSDAVAGDALQALLLLSAALAGWKTVSNGVRMYAASVAARTDRKRALDPLTRYRSSERVDSPTLRFFSFVLPVFFSSTIILGTVVLYQKKVPIDLAVLPHYGFMIFLGLTFITLSGMRTGSEGLELRSADRERLQPAALRKSRLQGFLLRMVGLWAGVLGCWMVVDALVLPTRLSDTTGAWRSFCIFFPLPLLYLGFAVQNAGKNILRHSRRHLARVIQSPSHLERETFVLYLRTFRSDNLQAGILHAGQLASGRSEEEQVAAAFRTVGPLVAVGRPGESLPYVGAIRMYLPRENWHQPVRELMTGARMVVIALGPAAGTMWEVEEALRILAPQRLVLLVPAKESDYRPFQLAKLRAGGVPVTLPPHPGVGRMGTELQAAISFGPGWRPVLGVFDESPFRPATYRNPLTAALRFQLRPVFAALTEYERQQPG